MELEDLLARYDINTHVDTFRFQFPSGFDQRLVEAPFSGMALRVFTLSNEDLAITKLLAWRDQDKQDLRGMLLAGNINVTALRGIANDVMELQVNLGAEAWAAFSGRLAEMESWVG